VSKSFGDQRPGKPGNFAKFGKSSAQRTDARTDNARLNHPVQKQSRPVHHRADKAREADDWVYGINAVEGQLQQKPDAILEVLVEKETNNSRVLTLLHKLEQLGVPVQRMPSAMMTQKLVSERHQGVAVRCEGVELLSESDLARLAKTAGNSALFLVLDGIQDPHNLGACIRSAAASGATAVVFPKDKSASVTAVTHRVSAGTTSQIPLVCVTNLARALEMLKEAGVWCYGAAGETKTSLYQLDAKGAVALVLGSEGEGLRRLTRETCDGLVAIPMAEGVESLNVSVAAGVMLFEVRRQRLMS
jgi:23S rRNA (guanosine2251-2'-O)-methyltransferase